MCLRLHMWRVSRSSCNQWQLEESDMFFFLMKYSFSYANPIYASLIHPQFLIFVNF